MPEDQDDQRAGEGEAPDRDTPSQAGPGEIDAALGGEPVPDADENLPVVARMVVEIRSDGSRTIARGAMEDTERGEKVAIRAEGASPLALAGSLARALTRLPRISRAFSDAPRAAGRAVRAFIEGYSSDDPDSK